MYINYSGIIVYTTHSATATTGVTMAITHAAMDTLLTLTYIYIHICAYVSKYTYNIDVL